MNPRRKNRMSVVISVLFLATIAVSLTLFALNENIDVFYTPSEIHQGKNGVTPAVGDTLRVGGMVVEGSVKRDPQTLQVSFLVTDTGPTVKVNYQGILPDLFREGQGIVVTGKLNDNYVVNATEVLAKHDENYMPPELAEKMKGIKHVKPSELDYQSYNAPKGQ